MLNVLGTLITSNIMIKEDTENNAKRFLPKSFNELIEYSEASDEFDGIIDLNILKLNLASRLNITDVLIGNMDVIPVKYSQSSTQVQWDVYSISFTNGDLWSIYLPGHYTVSVANDQGFITQKLIQELTTNDRIICKILGNVIIPQEIVEITKSGRYKIDEYVHLELPEDVYVPVGNSFIQVLIKE